jgi:hypothetical protein
VWIAGDGPGGWVPVAFLVLGATVVAAIAAASGRETYRVPLDVIDGRTGRDGKRPRFVERAPDRVEAEEAERTLTS